MNTIQSLRPRRGFTLIELLTVIAIIGILAAIIIPTVGKVRLAARQAECVSNLRQTGMAMMAYVNDNRGELPGRSGNNGGLQSAVTRRNSATERRQLTYHLAPYAGTPAPATGTSMVTLGILQEETTRLASQNPEENMQLWALNTRLKRTRHEGVPVATYYPFGWSAAGSELPPDRYDNLVKYVTASRVWAMIHVDRKLYVDFGADDGPYAPVSAPPNPVYGGHRNALFFDWSVRKIPQSVDVRDPL